MQQVCEDHEPVIITRCSTESIHCLSSIRNLHPLPLNLIEADRRGAGHIQRGKLSRHRDRADPVAELAYAATQADSLVADDQQGRRGEGAVGKRGLAVCASTDHLQARGLLAELF